MNKNFLLQGELSKTLYEAVKDLPIVDYHNHLCVKDLAEKRQFADLAELWILSDPYKHRAMRMCGVEERLITGDASPYEKYMAWAGVYPKLVGNPLYHWTQMELSFVFGIEEAFSPESAPRIWKMTEECLKKPEFSAPELLKKFHVEYAAPCASFLEDLTPFASMPELAPSMRGDDLGNINADFLQKLTRVTGVDVRSMADLSAAVDVRLDAFHRAGCRFSDHALDEGFRYYAEDGKNEERLQALRLGKTLSEEDRRAFFCAVLRLVGEGYAKRKWTAQLHIGAQRFTSSRLRNKVGPAGGFAGIGGGVCVPSLVSLLDDWDNGKFGMPQVLLFTLNPTDNAVMSVLSGSFSKDGVASLISQGPAWWWCDHMEGMREVFESISAYGLLSGFVGMTTDSRSILSFVRHDYFRRVFCVWLEEKVKSGFLPDDASVLSDLAHSVCYGNAKARLQA